VPLEKAPKGTHFSGLVAHASGLRPLRSPGGVSRSPVMV
jgi:hypothetical protein